MKVVINTYPGGFSLSIAAANLYAKKAGFELYHYTREKLNAPFFRAKGHEAQYHYSYKIDQGETFDYLPRNDSRLDFNGLDRADPIIIEIIEELGKAANGIRADLRILEIPDDVDWVVEEEHDGREHIAEKHRTWY